MGLAVLGLAVTGGMGALHAAPPALHCATPEAMRAIAGRPSRVPAAPPTRLDGRARPPVGRSMSAGKLIYGSNYAYHVETTNFTINWWDDGVDPAAATSAGVALEVAWTALLDEQGWPAPVGSDRYYLWVLLDPSLGDVTGYTIEYYTDDYPDGYPVIFLNPDYAFDEAFWASLAAHEFMHAIQFGMRSWERGDTGDDAEVWYWEASATHAAELANPDWDGHQYTSEWYARAPDLRYDSMVDGHQYGMFVLNAWLEERAPGTMLAAWEAGREASAEDWDGLIAEAAGLAVEEVWGGFTGAYGNERMRESELYEVAISEGALPGSGTLPYLGTHYWEAGAGGIVRADGDVVLSGPDGPADAVRLEPGDRLAVTALSDDADYTLWVEGDTGDADTGAGGIAPGRGLATPPGGCGCTAGGGGGWTWFALVLPALRRRRGG